MGEKADVNSRRRMSPRWPLDFIGMSGVVMLFYCGYQWMLWRQRRNEDRFHLATISFARAAGVRSGIYNEVGTDSSVDRKCISPGSLERCGLSVPEEESRIDGLGYDELNFISPSPHLNDRAWIVVCEAGEALRYALDSELGYRCSVPAAKKRKLSDDDDFVLLSPSHE